MWEQSFGPGEGDKVSWEIGGKVRSPGVMRALPKGQDLRRGFVAGIRDGELSAEPQLPSASTGTQVSEAPP